MPPDQAKQLSKITERALQMVGEVTGEIHFRASYAVSVIAMILVGATLGVIVRGGQVLTAFGINDSGEIVGFGATNTGDIHAFLATPTHGKAAESAGPDGRGAPHLMALPEKVRKLMGGRSASRSNASRRSAP